MQIDDFVYLDKLYKIATGERGLKEHEDILDFLFNSSIIDEEIVLEFADIYMSK